MHIYKDHKLLLCGDYNLPYVYWENNTYLQHSTNSKTPAPSTSQAALLSNGYASLDLQQHHPVHKLKDYTLDLVFSENHLISYLHSSDQLVPVDTLHHDSASFLIKTDLEKMSPKFTPRRNFKRMDVKGLLT